MRELPGGTVTFLFTDIEGSTRLLHELRERYVEVLAAHRRVLRDAFARHDGVEVDTQGDAFFVAFAKASDALAAAREAQAALEGPVRVRMGVHTGEPLVTDDGYVGIDVHRAARIAAAGHGGQVLVSRSTQQLVGADGLRDLGEHRLKDLTAPERIYQLGDRDFPPLKTLYQTNLPVQPTPLIGRERELADVIELVRSRRLVTLTGAGGSGKTRLALQAAAELVADFDDGVWFVSLSPLTDASLAEATIASVVGAKGQLAEFLRDKLSLLVLDNLEQLLPDIAPLVSRLDANVIATSRERLNVYGEQEYLVPTLTIPAATALFTERARLLEPSFEPDEHVRVIADRLDGLPLAIELAAARTKVLTPRQIAERLVRSLDLLTAGSRDVPERQRTLRATIDWSYRLLTQEEQQAFVRLGVFAGSFDVDAAEEVAGTGLDTLASLVDKSLLRKTQDRRFFMLATIREYASERFAGTEDAREIRRRHAMHAIENASKPPVEQARAWRTAVERAYPDFRAALTWLSDEGLADDFARLAAGLSLFWEDGDYLGEGRTWLERALATAGGSGPERARARVALARILWEQGDLDSARAEVVIAADEAHRLGDRSIEADAATIHGSIEGKAGRLDIAEDRFRSAMVLYEEIGEERGVAWMTHNLGVTALMAGDTVRAHRLFDEALDHARAVSNLWLEASSLGNLGLTALEEGRAADARDLARAALRTYADAGLFVLSTAYELYTLAAAIAEGGSASDACLLIGAADAYFAEVGAVRETLWERARSHTRQIAAARLGSGRAQAAEHAGADLPLSDAVALALK